MKTGISQCLLNQIKISFNIICIPMTILTCLIRRHWLYIKILCAENIRKMCVLGVKYENKGSETQNLSFKQIELLRKESCYTRGRETRGQG